MRFSLFLALALLAPALAAQTSRPGSGFVFAPVDQVDVSASVVASVHETLALQAYVEAVGASTLVPRRGHAIYSASDGCREPGPCLLFTSGHSSEIVLVDPFASEGGLGGTRITTLYAADAMQAGRGSLDVFAPSLRSTLQIVDGTVADGLGYDLYTSSPSGIPDCAATGTSCYVVVPERGALAVFEVRASR